MAWFLIVIDILPGEYDTETVWVVTLSDEEFTVRSFIFESEGC
jgi:hypothetical protein